MTSQDISKEPVAVCTFAVATATAALCTDWFLTSLAIPIFPMLGSGDMAIGVLFASEAIVQMIVAPFVGYLVDRWGILLLLCALVLEAITVGIFAVTFSYSQWFLARSLQGVSSAFITATAFGHLATRFKSDDEMLGRAMSIAISGLILGIGVGPPVGGMLFSMNPCYPYYFGFLLLLATFVLALLELHNSKRIDGDEHQSTNAGEEPSGSWCQLLVDPLVSVPLLAVLVTNIVIASYEGSIGIFAFKTFGFESYNSGLLFAWVSIPSAVFSSVAGMRSIQRFGRWQVVTGGVVVMAVGCGIRPKTVLEVLAPSLSLLGIGIGVSAATIPALLAAASKRHGGTAAVYSMQNAAEQLGFLIGPVCGNWISLQLGFGNFSTLAAILLMLLVPVLWWARTKADQLYFHLQESSSCSTVQPEQAYGKQQEPEQACGA